MQVKADDLSPVELYSLMTSVVIPRPVALVSTVNQHGLVNIAPFSYFNAVSTVPPLLMIAPVKTIKDGQEKDTFQNLNATDELVIHLVNEKMLPQMLIASANYPADVSEADKAGFSMVASDCIAVPRILEATVAMECAVQQIIVLGDEGGAGRLILCRLLKMHIADEILDERNLPDPLKMNVIARLGGTYYAKINASSIFKMPRPGKDLPIGMDHLPSEILNDAFWKEEEKAYFALQSNSFFEAFPFPWTDTKKNIFRENIHHKRVVM